MLLYKKYVTSRSDMKKQLEKYFGCTVNVNEYMEKLNLPIYMTMRHIDIGYLHFLPDTFRCGAPCS